jgi:hypothetical protein
MHRRPIIPPVQNSLPQQVFPGPGSRPMNDIQFMQTLAQRLLMNQMLPGFNGNGGGNAGNGQGNQEFDVIVTSSIPTQMWNGSGGGQGQGHPGGGNGTRATVEITSVPMFDEHNYFVADDIPQHGLTPDQITALPIQLTRKGAKKEKCTICQENYSSDRFHKQLPCGHYFHPHCISEWLSRNVKCPTCRGAVSGNK